MRILSQYIVKTLLFTTSIVVVAFLSLDFFIQLITELGDIGSGNYTLLTAMEYVFLVLPNDLYTLFPIAGLVGCMLGLGLLASNSELIAMQAAGFSTLQIIRSVLYGILMMVFLITISSELLVPLALKTAEQLKSNAKSNGQAISSNTGIWIRDANTFLHIHNVKNKTHLEGVTRYQFSENNQLTNVAFAKKASYQNNQWNMQNVATTIIHGDSLSATNQKTAIWSIKINPDLLKLAVTDPAEMPLSKLWIYISYQKKNKLHYQLSSLNFWQRIFQPLGIATMMFIAIPFVFGPLRNASLGLRLVTGIMLGFSFYLLNQFFGPFSLLYHIPPYLGALLPSIIFLCLTYMVLRYVLRR